MIRPPAMALAMLMGVMRGDRGHPVRKQGPSFEELESEYELIQQKKSSLSYSRRCEIEYQYNRMVVARSRADVSKNKS